MNTTTAQLEQTRPLIEPLAVDIDGLRRLLGASTLSSVTVWRMEKAGHIRRVPVLGKRLFTIQSVRDYVAGKTTANRKAPSR